MPTARTSMRPITGAPSLMTIVDTATAKPLWSFYGSETFVNAEAGKWLERADAGDYGLDYSELCKTCKDYHSPEADCEA